MDTYKGQNEIEIYYIICAKLIKAIEVYKLAVKFVFFFFQIFFFFQENFNLHFQLKVF